MTKQQQENIKDVPTLINNKYKKKLDKIAEDDKKKLLKKLREFEFPEQDLISELLIKNKFFYLLYIRLQDMANIFAEKNEKIKKKYLEMLNEYENSVQKELVVQENFLEYNDNIDKFIRSLDKNVLNEQDFLTEEKFLKDINSFPIIQGDQKQYFKKFFLYSNDNKNFVKLHDKYSKMTNEELIVKII